MEESATKVVVASEIVSQMGLVLLSLVGLVVLLLVDHLEEGMVEDIGAISSAKGRVGMTTATLNGHDTKSMAFLSSFSLTLCKGILHLIRF